ncbi:MAG: tripartite tricarboxylate transporter substrate binding protein [Proteobacteria bacterium]|nr:tripartite tricarboxylate transporter substrate binding protein [Pseudomonadota bacterium]
MKRLHTFMAAAAAVSLAGAAPAQDWPTRPVRIVSTFAAGGSADFLARMVAEQLSSAFGQQFFVETRAGAGGAIGVQSVVASAPDGYNLVITNISLLVLAPMSNPKLGFDPRHDLVNIAYIAGSPLVLSASAKSGMNTLADFLARAKASDKPLAYSSSGLGTSGHLAVELFAHSAGIRVAHVPYKGASQGLADLVGGHIAFAMQTVTSSAGLLRGGVLNGLAVTAPTRLEDYPALPTFSELGFPDLVSTTWFSLSAPAGLPAGLAQTINREVVRAMQKSDVRQRLLHDGMIVDPMSIEAFERLIEGETRRWRPAMERAGLVAK